MPLADLIDDVGGKACLCWLQIELVVDMGRKMGDVECRVGVREILACPTVDCWNSHSFLLFLKMQCILSVYDLL